MLAPASVTEVAPPMALEQSLPPPPRLSIAVPFARAEYSSSGVFVVYCARVHDETNDLEWLTCSRYSAYRKLHSAVGKHHVASSLFPSLIITGRGNRSKAAIEGRRVKLEAYMRALLDAVFAPQGPKSVPFHHAARVLQFLEYPFAADWDALLRLSTDAENESVPSQETAAQQQAIAALGTGTSSTEGATTAAAAASHEGNHLATSRWRAPPVVPGPHLGIALPFAVLQQGIEGDWEVLIRGDRSAKKGLLRHRYDECAALAFKLARSSALLDPAEAQDFIIEFRRRHPIAAYMRFERVLEAHTPASLSSRRDGLSDSEMGEERRAGCDADAPSGTSNDSFGSPVIHLSRRRSFPVDADDAAASSAAEAELYVTEAGFGGNGDGCRVQRSSCTHFALADTHRSIPTAIIHQAVYHSPSRAPAALADTPPSKGPTGDCSPPRTPQPSVRDAGVSAPAATPRPPLGSGLVSGQEKYLSLVRGNRVAGCQCSQDAFCSTQAAGDLYETAAGFAIIVCPPADA